MSLRIKLLIFSLILALIPLGVAGRSMIQITRDELKSSAQDNLITVATQVSQNVDDFCISWLEPLRMIRKALESEYLNRDEKVSLLAEGMRNISDIVSLQISVEGIEEPFLVVKDEFAEPLTSSGALKLRADISEIRTLPKQDEFFISDPAYLKAADIWLINVFLLLDEKTFGRPATLAARISLGRIRTRIGGFRKTDFIITLIDARGHKIFDPAYPDLNAYELVSIARERMSGKHGSIPVKMVWVRPDGSRMLGTCAFPKGLRLGAIVEQDEASAYLAVSHMERKLLMWIAFGIFLAVIGAIVVSISLTRPLRILRNAARKISEGDLSHHIRGRKRRDEIGELSQTFNKMVEDLRHYMRDLEETTREKEKVESELSLAKNIQQSFLPDVFPELEEIDVWGKCDPAREVGGDYFDFFGIDDERYGMVIGDVSGKGVPASLFMAVSRTLFRILCSQNLSPQQVLTDFNDRLVELDQGSNMFITMFYAVFNIRTGKLIYSTAGHNMPYIRFVQKENGEFQMLPNMKPTMVAGIMDGMPMPLAELSLDRGDTLVLYTDGMTEPINKDEEEFGEERLAELLNKYKDLSSKEMCENLIGDVKAYQADMPQFDDMTMFILKVREYQHIVPGVRKT